MFIKKGKIWNYIRFITLVLITIFFLFSLFQLIKYKILVLIILFLLIILFYDLKKVINLLIRIIILNISIIICKFIALLFSTNFKEINFFVEFIKIANQILNISNSILLSSIIFKVLPLKNFEKLNFLENFMFNIKSLTIEKFKEEKINIKSIPSFFAYIIYESYKMYYIKQNQDTTNKAE